MSEDEGADCIFEDEEEILEPGISGRQLRPDSIMLDQRGARKSWLSSAEFFSAKIEPLVLELFEFLGSQIRVLFPRNESLDGRAYSILSMAILCVGAWQLETAVETFLNDSEQCLKLAGYSAPKGHRSASSAAIGRQGEPGSVCPILDIECDKMLVNPLCGHWACPRAWEQYLKALDHPPRGVRCIFCHLPLCPSLVEQALSPADLALWRNRIVEDYLRLCCSVKHCPSTDCEGLLECENCVKFDYQGAGPPAEPAISEEESEEALPCSSCESMVCRVCERGMCLRCGFEDHLFLPCEMFCDWQRESNSDSQNALWLLVHTKNCPNCSKPIEKNQGCMHMTCKCSHEFCWLCLDRWSKHSDSFRCNFYDENGGRTIFEIKHDLSAVDDQGQPVSAEVRKRILDKSTRYLNKYTYYFGRFISHQRGADVNKVVLGLRKFKQQQVDAKVLLADPPPLAFFEAVQTALDTIVYGRTLLKLTYVFGFYARWRNSSTKLLFEDQQGQMERALDLLQETTENHQTEIRAGSYEVYISTIAHLTRVVNDFFGRMREAFSRELITEHSLYRIIPREDAFW